jgi:hypothetical protein
MTKKVSFARANPKNPDEWVAGSGETNEPQPAEAVPAEPMKRLTIDIPKSLHTRIKAGCAVRGSKMVDEIRILLEREFADQQTR